MGRTRARRRWLAAAIVLGSATGAFALSRSPTTPSPASNPSIPPGSTGRVVFAIRNTEASAVTITSWSSGTGLMGLGKPGLVALGPPCTELGLPVDLGGGNGPWTLQPGEVQQFQVHPAMSLAAGDHSCLYSPTSDSTDATPVTVTVTFHVTTGATWDVQPNAIDFGSQSAGNSESQTVIADDFGGSGSAVSFSIVNDPINNFTLGCGSAHLCTIPEVAGGTAATVHCNGLGSSTAMLEVTSGAGSSSVVLSCDAGAGLSVNPPTLLLATSEGSTVTSDVTVSGPGTLDSASGAAGPISIAGCPSPTPCAYPLALPVDVTIACTPVSTTQMSQITFSGSAGSADLMVACSPTSGAPQLIVTPQMLTFTETSVGSMDSAMFTIANGGGGSLSNVTVALTSGDTSSFEVDDCGGCSLGAGSSQQLSARFVPQVHGALQAQVTITADDGSATQSVGLALDGTGDGGVMVVTEPTSPYDIDFGTLPLDAVGSATIRLRNDGNLPYFATLTPAAAPYTLSATGVNVDGNGGSANVDVTCSSSTPSASNDSDVTITSDAYTGSPQVVHLKCAIADTHVIVDPLAVDFGEQRVGTTVAPVAITVTNPGPGSVLLTALHLRSSIDGLSLAPSDTTATLAVNDVATASLSLDTSADTDLTGELIDIDVDGSTLSIPVRGRVVTPHSRIVPAELDLGTACVGTNVSGSVRLINDGTATLSVDAPDMDANNAFYATTAQAQYPVSLPAGQEIEATVTPSPASTGTLAGTLTWSDDSPATYAVPIALEYVTSGTALSPRGLDFGAVEVDGLVPSQRVMLENCDPDTHTIEIEQLRGIRGPIGAWRLDPAVGFEKQLGSHETQALVVSFDPPGRGHYEADILVKTDSGQETIKLLGDATGRDFGSTSFYACACSAPGRPWTGWPIAGAIVAISVRRRRRGSS